MKSASRDVDYHLKWDLIEDPFPAAWDEEIPDHHYNLTQTRKYLEVCLRQAGGDGTPIFTEDDIHRIYLASGGVPGRVNRLARQWLSDPADVASLHAGNGLPLSFWLTGGAVAAAVLLLLSWVIAPEPENADAKTPAVAVPAADAKTPKVKNDFLRLPAKTALSEETETALKEETPPPQPAAAAKPQAETAAMKPQIKSGSKTETVSVKKRTALIPGTRTLDWIRQQDGKSYTLQLVGARELVTIGRYITLSGLNKSDLALVKTSKEGRDWYVLTYGVYTNKDRARRAIPRLPAYARKQKPWPRRLADLAGEAR